MIYRFGTSSDIANQIASAQSSSMRTDMEQTNSLLSMHAPDSADMAYAAKLAGELIAISGANVTVYPRTDNSDFDRTWEEDPDPTYYRGHHMKAFFAPQPLASELTPWGVDTPNQADVIFSRQNVINEFNKRMIRIGDIIELPYGSVALRPDRFRVLNAFDSGNFRYTWLYFTCKVENITDDITIDIDHK